MKIEYFCFSGHNGYASAACNYIQALRLHHSVRIIPLGFSKYGLSSGETRIFHCTPEVSKRYTKGKHDISFATFETLDPPITWKHLLKDFEHLIVPSQFNKELFSSFSKREPIYLPHCLDMNVFKPSVKPLVALQGFSFLFIGTWRRRKGYDVLVDAFLEEFAGENQVSLHLRTRSKDVHNFISDRQIPQRDADNSLRSAGKSQEISHIFINEDEIPASDLPSYIKSFDCLVLPTRGEGFGLPPLEAMAVGVPVIVTNYSGCKDYANEKTAWLLEPKGFEMVEQIDGIPQFHQKKWAKILVSDLRALMRRVIENKNERNERALYAADFVRNYFSHQKICSMWDDRMDQVISS